jgi:hypothetical protein
LKALLVKLIGVLEAIPSGIRETAVAAGHERQTVLLGPSRIGDRRVWDESAGRKKPYYRGRDRNLSHDLFCPFAHSKDVLEPRLEAVEYALQAAIGNSPTVYEFESNVGPGHRAPKDVSMDVADRAIVGPADNGRVVVELITAVNDCRTHRLGPPMLIGGKRTECGLRVEQGCAVERGAGSNPVVQVATYPRTAVGLSEQLVFAERVDLNAKTEAVTKVLGVCVRACPELIESTSDRVIFGFTTELPYHILYG